MPIHRISGGGGLQLAVHEYGQSNGKPILLIHGFSQCHLVWSKQYQSPLADEFRLVCLDNRGHGMSEKPTALEHYTQAERWADDVQAVITGLALRQPVLVGWSYGGLIINDYLATYGQDTLGGINYVAAAVLLGVGKAANTFGSGFTDHVADLCSENLEDNIRAVRALLRAVFKQQPTQDEFEVLVALNMIVPPAVRLGLVSRTIDRDVVMQALTLPVLVTEGEKDGLVLASHSAHLRSCIPHAQASVYRGIGHAPPFEAPERFNRELAAFARQHAG
jgi:pimeloyl-ACP methyl ester carboxylesterase